MKLSSFIRTNKEEINYEWTRYAQENIDRTTKMQKKEVSDHIMQMLDWIVEDMESSQSDYEQEKKSKGNKNFQNNHTLAASDHGEQRLNFGFDFMQLSSEFRALRASVLRLWSKKSRAENWETDFHDMIRFNEAIDELWMVSLKRFQEKLDQSKNLFLGILGHDLRNPIATITGAHSLLKISKNLSEREQEVLNYSNSSIKRMIELINNLLELTELQLGGGMSINKKEINLSKHTQKIVQEIQLAYPNARIEPKLEDGVKGNWDLLRLEQMMTNLLTNAIRHGEKGKPIHVDLNSEEDKAIFSVHNEGEPIPESMRERIFDDGFTGSNRGPIKEKSYGLGLYIVQEIVEGHQGEIKLSSSEEHGTTFKIFLPKK